ncbi:MAG TPA: fused MFS/spermidine synthase [Solirubrobacteraceae bacterium]|nr:fused MFS/spermidine synthase [Solirubrobacteraceae bacterium]
MSRRRSQPRELARRGELIVERDPDRPSGRLLRQRDMEASYVDLADPRHLEFDYLRWMRIVLVSVRARRNLHIGGGACALPRALAAEDPHGRQEVCEVDGQVLAMAREHLGLRRAPGLRVRQAEGGRFLSQLPSASFDAVVIDAFQGAAVPAELVSAVTLSQAARVAPLVLINVVDDRAARVVCEVTDGISAAFAQAWRIRGRGGNSVLLGGPLSEPAQHRIAGLLAGDLAPAQLDPVAVSQRTS